MKHLTPEQVREHMASNPELLLVCAYEETSKCVDAHVRGALNLQQFEARVPQLAPQHEIVFFCA